MAFSDGGLGETAFWPPKSGFPQKSSKKEINMLLVYVGLLPLAAQAPASTCAALMDLLEQAGIFSLDKVEEAD